MGHCRTVGDVRPTFRHPLGVGLEWEIPDFLSLPDTPDCIFYSPDFPHRGALWYLIVYPNGQAYCASQGWIVLFLCRRPCREEEEAVRFGLGLRRADGGQEDRATDLRLPGGCTHLRVNGFLPRSELLKRRRELAPSGYLTVTCTIFRDEAHRVPDNILINNDGLKPTSVPFKFKEQMDNNATTDDRAISDKIVIKDMSGDISRKKAKIRGKEKGVSNMQNDIRRTVKCILKFVGNCVRRSN